MKLVDRLSDETKQEIIKLYTDTKTSTHAICTMYGFGASVLMDIITEAGVPYRRPNQVGIKRRIRKTVVCRFCKNSNNPKGAKYCCECGKSLLTEKEMILRQLDHLTKYFVILDLQDRDRYIKEINSIIVSVKNLKVEEEEER